MSCVFSDVVGNPVCLRREVRIISRVGNGAIEQNSFCSNQTILEHVEKSAPKQIENTPEAKVEVRS
jgi:hypothetical protein